MVLSISVVVGYSYGNPRNETKALTFLDAAELGVGMEVPLLDSTVSMLGFHVRAEIQIGQKSVPKR
jgi:hypothetical protein